MAITIYKIKKWGKMLSGNSVFHVNQGEGKIYSKDSVAGYYNDLTEKITRFGLPDDSVPKSFVDTGEEIYFSISIFQYGLAAYDLYLITGDQKYLPKVKNCADWAVENQQADGAWITFAYQSKEAPYSAMAQGEAISLLVRANMITGEDKYLEAAKKAKSFMMKPIEKGGTTLYDNGGIILCESTDGTVILNGWIFPAWGLFDYAKTFNDEQSWREWNNTVDMIAKWLPKYDCGYWSMYHDLGMIASPFYHKLHIAQLRVMYKLTGDERFAKYADKFEKYQNNWVYRKIAFCRKAFQKVLK